MEMKQPQHVSTRQLKRIAALPYNPYFKEAVRRIQSGHGVPVGEKALDWFFNEYVPKYGKCVSAHYFDKSEYPSLEEIQACRLEESEVPLEQDIVELLSDFWVQFTTFVGVLKYVLTGDTIWLAPSEFEPKVTCSLDFRKGIEFKVTIDGLSPWTTKKQWAYIWDSEVERSLKRTRDFYSRVFPSRKETRKRITLESYSNQLKCWSEWYQLSEIQGLGPTKALAKWINDHPDQSDKYDTSTVTHAIEEFRKIIIPYSAKD